MRTIEDKSLRSVRRRYSVFTNVTKFQLELSKCSTLDEAIAEVKYWTTKYNSKYPEVEYTWSDFIIFDTETKESLEVIR